MHRRRFIASLGTTIALPCVAAAQQKEMPVIGFLAATGSPGGLTGPLRATFRQGLSETGYVEGQNVAIENRWLRAAMIGCGIGCRPRRAQGRFDRDKRRPPVGTCGKSATSTIPIVFTGAGDPV